jgi:catechol 2,3-dioxygenase-like lactoylglutathione lyase family enzyme
VGSEKLMKAAQISKPGGDFELVEADDGKLTSEAMNMNMKLEVVIIPVSDVDRAKAFYEKAGFRLDADFATDNFRVLQFTPPQSEASIIFGKGVTSAKPGSFDGLVLAVGCRRRPRRPDRPGCQGERSFSLRWRPVQLFRENPQVAGRDPEGRSYFSFVSFENPDGNRWLLQEITARLPGREWKSTPAPDVATLAELLHETEQHHGHYEKTHGEHHWWDWYAPYLSARQNGGSPDEATAAADRSMAERFQIPAR